MRKFSITIDIAVPAERVWQVMSDTDRWHEWTPSVISVKRLGGGPFAAGSRATLSLDLQGIFGGVFGRMTKGITERYLAFEASGLKARSENPGYRHGEAGR
jgi:ligand-binding SRPBCC domain-containing protein